MGDDRCCKAEIFELITARPEKQVELAVTVSIPADVDAESREGERIIRDLIANEFYSMRLAK